MSRFLITMFFLVIFRFVLAQDGQPVYDSVLARSLGADDYGMKSYILVILKTGSNQITDKVLRDSLFAGHMRNINHLAEEGKLIVAGPLGSNENAYRGIFILNTNSEQEAREMLQTDPVIREKVLAADLYKWYGSAALPTYLEVHRKIEKLRP